MNLTDGLHNPLLMAENFYNFLNEKEAILILKRLPKKETNLKQFFNCLAYEGSPDMWGRIFQIVAQSNTSKCYSYARCGLHSVPKKGANFNI
jgi:hypothetical protein